MALGTLLIIMVSTESGEVRDDISTIEVRYH